jgi:cytochrome c oxidase cbb3-type subunit 3
VKVTLPNGRTSSGTLVAITDFYVTLVDATGARRTFPRDNDVPRVEVTDPLQAHLDMLLKYTDVNMHNLTAYLVTLK